MVSKVFMDKLIYLFLDLLLEWFPYENSNNIMYEGAGCISLTDKGESVLTQCVPCFSDEDRLILAVSYLPHELSSCSVALLSTLFASCH